ncbi:MAG: hypothetical protein ABL949_07510 [Fimbriimonadaceae bacterium]
MITAALLATALATTGPQTQGLLDFETHAELALGVAALSPQTARFDPELLKLYGPTEFTSPLFSIMHSNPWRVPYFSETLRREASGATGSPADLFSFATRLVGYNTRRSLIGSPIKSAEELSLTSNGLNAVLQDFKSSGLIKGEIPALTGVPFDVQRAATLVLATMSRSVKYRRLALKSVGNVEEAYLFLATNARDELEGENQDRLIRLARGLDLAYLGAAANDIALAAAQAQEAVAKVAPTAKYNFEVETTWGTIRLSGGGVTQYPDKPLLLAIDTGGKDTYLNVPSTSTAANWTSVVIDTDGDDSYLSDASLATQPVSKLEGRKLSGAKPGPGGALLGVTILVDTAGNDLYRSHRCGLGSGRFGFGLLLDREGSDVYDSYADSQGFGDEGIGILSDQLGDDKFSCFANSQGVGLTRGVGVLVDGIGDDSYVANDTVIDLPSPQSDKHNVSMSQGAATGRRADYTDGHSLAGGVGILYDIAGNDSYTCGVFGQGVGYWQGVGLLWDDGGVDHYIGQWYVQGAAAHFAVGYLEDGSGNDQYEAPMNMAQGAGHDYSIGLLFDRAGDDSYKAPNLSLGAGNANGIGIFADLIGSDTYASSGLTLGKASEAQLGTLRGRAQCLGLFMDLAGDDTYPNGLGWVGDARKSVNWTYKGPTSFESQVGVFYDR